MRKVCYSALICFALLSSIAAAQQGTITGVTVSENRARAGSSVTATVSGSAGVCGAVEINWGDGDVVTYPTSYLPVKQDHVYRTAGTFTVRARGIANCGGDAATRLEILAPPEPPQDRRPPAAPRGTITGIEMGQSARIGQDMAITIVGTGTCRLVLDFDNGEERTVDAHLPYRFTYRFKEIGLHEIVVWTDDACSGSAEKVVRITPAR